MKNEQEALIKELYTIKYEGRTAYEAVADFILAREKALQDRINGLQKLTDDYKQNYRIVFEENVELQSKLAEAEKNIKYWVEQHGIETEKRGEAEHQIDLARGSLAESFEKMERERDSLQFNLTDALFRVKELNEANLDFQRNYGELQLKMSDMQNVAMANLKEVKSRLDEYHDYWQHAEKIVAQRKDKLERVVGKLKEVYDANAEPVHLKARQRLESIIDAALKESEA